MPNLSTMALLFVVEGTVMTGTAGKKSRCLCTDLSLMLHDEEKSMKMAKILAFGSISPLAGLLNTFTPLTLLIQYKEGIDIDEKNLTGKNTGTKTNILF